MSNCRRAVSAAQLPVQKACCSTSTQTRLKSAVMEMPVRNTPYWIKKGNPQVMHKFVQGPKIHKNAETPVCQDIPHTEAALTCRQWERQSWASPGYWLDLMSKYNKAFLLLSPLFLPLCKFTQSSLTKTFSHNLQLHNPSAGLSTGQAPVLDSSCPQVCGTCTCPPIYINDLKVLSLVNSSVFCIFC